MTNATIKLGDSIGMFGSTGTGKTSVSKEIVKNFYSQSNGKIPIYILDSKNSGDFSEFTKQGVGVHYYGNNLPPLYNKKGEGSFIVWTPDTDNPAMYNDWFEKIYLNARNNHQPCFIYIDELSSISTSGGSTPLYYDTLLKQGRGLGCSTLSLIQLSRYTSINFSSQITHLFVFNMNNIKDKTRMIENYGLSKQYKIPDQFGFWYRDLKKPVFQNPPKYFATYKDFF
jgi:Cdc6-like AAA superfamily ATPase